MKEKDEFDAKVFTAATSHNVADLDKPEKTNGIAVVTNIGEMVKAEIDSQVTTAKMYPRDIQRARAEAFEMATIDEEIAESCFYDLPRGGRNIPGPSVRLAEIFNYAWGNVRVGARIIAVEREFVVAQGVHHDLERNIFSSIEVKRRITDSHGKRYNEDMIGVTANAACSIAYRNATFKNIPRVYVDFVYKAARRVAVGDITTLSERRSKCIDHFAKMGVTIDRVLECIDVNSVEEIGLEELEKLIGLSTAIKCGDTTIDQTFPVDKPKYTGSGKAVGEIGAFDKPADYRKI